MKQVVNPVPVPRKPAKPAPATGHRIVASNHLVSQKSPEPVYWCTSPPRPAV